MQRGAWGAGMTRIGRDGRLKRRMQNKLDKLAEAGERLITAKTTETWMGVIIGFGLVMLLIWSFQAVCLGLREIAKAGGM
jgi:hypothetical protein